MSHVVILQEYVPEYRKPFFNELVRLAELRGIEIRVAAGNPSHNQAKRMDETVADYIDRIPQRELRIFGRRLVLRQIKPVIRGANLVIMEQARRNIDAYTLLFRRDRTIKVALWGHGRDYVKLPTRFERKLSGFLTKRADWFFAYTHSGATSVERHGFPQSQISVVRNAIDTREIARTTALTSADDLRDFKSAHGLTDNVAVFVGGLDDSKRIPFLLAAAKRAHSVDESFRLLVVGAGKDKQLIEEAVKESEAVILAGALHGKKKATAILSAKVIAMPGRVGLVAVDSFAFGRPIVTTDWPWHAPEFEYLTAGIDCVIAKDDISAFADALLTLMNDEQRLKTMQELCRSNSEDYSTEIMAHRYLDGISSVLGMEN